jgi:hypothetical protein
VPLQSSSRAATMPTPLLERSGRGDPGWPGPGSEARAFRRDEEAPPSRLGPPHHRLRTNLPLSKRCKGKPAMHVHHAGSNGPPRLLRDCSHARHVNRGDGREPNTLPIREHRVNVIPADVNCRHHDRLGGIRSWLPGTPQAQPPAGVPRVRLTRIRPFSPLSLGASTPSRAREKIPP